MFEKRSNRGVFLFMAAEGGCYQYIGYSLSGHALHYRPKKIPDNQ